jgi:hypothetical protein
MGLPGGSRNILAKRYGQPVGAELCHTLRIDPGSFVRDHLRLLATRFRDPGRLVLGHLAATRVGAKNPPFRAVK